jgi:hypothetical protein
MEEVISAGSNLLAVLFLIGWLGMPMFAYVILPEMKHKQPELPTGCRLFWQVDSHSWYSCSLLASTTTHQRMAVSLLFLAAGAFVSVVCAFACYCTATAVKPQLQQSWFGWAKHALSAVWLGLYRMCQDAFQVMLKLASRSQDEQDALRQAAAEGRREGLQTATAAVGILRTVVEDLTDSSCLHVQAALLVIQEHLDKGLQRATVPEQLANHGLDLPAAALPGHTAFAKHWWWHTAAAYAGMSFHGAYCTTIVMLLGLQIDPFKPQYEGLCVHGIAMVLWLVRSYHGMMEWRTIPPKREHAL